jgi:hypothetical protein
LSHRRLALRESGDLFNEYTGKWLRGVGVLTVVVAVVAFFATASAGSK